MTYKTKKCPHCGHVLTFMETQTAQYGSPFRQCQSCGCTYIDKDYREIAVTGIRFADSTPFSPGWIFCSLFPLFLTLSGLWNGFNFRFDGESIFLIVVGLLIFLFIGLAIRGELKNRKQMLEWLEEEKRKSEIRLSNPEYAKALKELGYPVPQRFLPHDKGTGEKK